MTKQINRKAGIMAIVALITTMFAGSAIGQPASTPPEDAGDTRKFARSALKSLGKSEAKATVKVPACYLPVTQPNPSRGKYQKSTKTARTFHAVTPT